jgi:uncharacterized integral membrane protein
MRYLTWSFRAILFILFLGFAVKNDHPVTLRYFFNYEWQTSLVVVLLCFFTIGVAVGLLAMFSTLFKQRRMLAAAQSELQMQHKLSEIGAQRHPVQPT